MLHSGDFSPPLDVGLRPMFHGLRCSAEEIRLLLVLAHQGFYPERTEDCLRMRFADEGSCDNITTRLTITATLQFPKTVHLLNYHYLSAFDHQLHLL